jgi:hypothetical protein
MARCPFEKIEHLTPLFEEIKKWEGIKETKPGIFYLKNSGFLHFHEKEGKIWADIKSPSSWVSFDIPVKITKKFNNDFKNLLRLHYENIK